MYTVLCENSVSACMNKGGSLHCSITLKHCIFLIFIIIAVEDAVVNNYTCEYTPKLIKLHIMNYVRVIIRMGAK